MAKRETARGISGWLLVYVIGSVPPMVVYSIGLSGWFVDYPFWLVAGIFLLLAVPLLLVLVGHRTAPKWNIAAMWIIAGLMTLRSLNVFVLPVGGDGQPPPRGEELQAVILTLAGIVSFSLIWAAAWTKYFRESERVRNTFSIRPGPAS